MKSARTEAPPETLPASITAVEGDELKDERRPATWILRAVLALITSVVALVAALRSIGSMDLLPADPLLRILQPIGPRILAWFSAPGSLSETGARMLVVACALLLVVIALPWFRAARDVRRRGTTGPVLYAAAISIAAIWTIVTAVAPRALASRAIPYDPLAPSAGLAIALIMAAQAISLMRLERLRERLRESGISPRAIAPATLPGSARFGLRRARVLFWLSIAAALAASIIWLAVGSLSSLPNAIVAAIAVLLATAPVAFSLSGTYPWSTAVARAAKQGLQAETADALDRMARSRSVIAGLGGSVLIGHGRVSDTAMLGVDQKELLSVAAAIELFATHPVATAIVRRAESLRPDLPGVTEFVELPGEGATAKLDGQRAAVGSLELMRRLGLNTDQIREEVQHWASEGKTAVVVAVAGKVIGAIGVTREPAEGTSEAIVEMQREGIRCVLVSGATADETRAIGERLGFDESGSSAAAEREEIVRRAQEPIVAVGGTDDLSWMKPAAARVVVSPVDPGIAADAFAADTTPLLSLARGLKTARRARAAASRALFHAAAHHVIAIPLVSGVVFPLAHWIAPSWLVWIASPVFAAAFTAVATIAVTEERVDND